MNTIFQLAATSLAVLVLSMPAKVSAAVIAPSIMPLNFYTTDVSADGRVVVGARNIIAYFPTGDPYQSEEAVTWTRAGGEVGLGFIFNDTDYIGSWAHAVSGDGSVVVGSNYVIP